jgi:hypothetical protein
MSREKKKAFLQHMDRIAKGPKKAELSELFLARLSVFTKALY